MSVVLAVEFEIELGKEDVFDKAIHANALASLVKERGCFRFDICVNPDAPNEYFLYEIYRDEAAISEHLKSQHYLQMEIDTSGVVKRKNIRKFILDEERRDD